jgi:hypothetical protein
MAITIDNTTVYATPDNSTNISVSHTVSGSNRYMLVGLLCSYGDIGTSFSSNPAYNSSAMNLIGDSGISGNGWAWTRVYDIIAPSAGTFNFTYTWSSVTSGRTLVVVRSYIGVDQTTPHGTVVTNTNYSTTPSVVVSSASGELISDFLSTYSLSTIAPDASQTQIANQADTSGYYKGASDKAGASSVTMQWTMSIMDWTLVAVPIKPVSGGGGASGGLFVKSPKLYSFGTSRRSL